MKSASSDPTIFCRFLLFGALILPLELGFSKGYPSSSKKTFFLLAITMSDLGGTPLTSMIHLTYSFSSSPAKMGKPTNSSKRIQPKDHMSIAGVYFIPSIISGAL
jgi:hypothetical protein